MTPFFKKNVDRRSRAAMVDFLQGHCRYDTLRSWNRLTSYANNIKIHRLGLSSEQDDKAYQILGVDYWDDISSPVDDFTLEHDHRYTMALNGRSDGYLVLHESALELTGHLSYCPNCGQRNFKKVPPKTYQDNNETVIAREILNSRNAWHPWRLSGSTCHSGFVPFRRREITPDCTAQNGIAGLFGIRCVWRLSSASAQFQCAAVTLTGGRQKH